MYENAPALTKKILLVTLGLLLTFFQSISQNPKIDSLETLLTTSPTEVKFEIYVELLKEAVRIKDYEKAIKLNSTASEIAFALGDSSKIVRCGRNSGIIYNRWGRHNEATRELSKVLPIAKRNNFAGDYQDILNNLGLAYGYMGRYDDALKIHFQNLQFREAAKNSVGIFQSLNNIGIIYYKLKNFDKAIEFYQSALTISKRESNGESGFLLVNIGLCYNQKGEYDVAKKYFAEGFEICQPNCDALIEMEGKLGLGISSYYLKSYKEARKYFEESLAISEKLGDYRFQAENLLSLARLDFANNKVEEGLRRLMSCEAISKEQKFSEVLIEAYNELQQAYKKKQDFENVTKYQGLYIHLKDSIYSGKLLDNLTKIQTDYAERENIKTIATKDFVIEQQRDLNVAVAIIAMLALLLILVLMRGNRVSKQVNAQLSEAKETIQEQNKLLEIKNKDLDREVEKKTVDLERVNLSLKQVNDELDNFIYKTSHDIRGPLASLKGMCNVALMDVKDPVALDYLRKLDSTAERLNSILTRLLIINQINNSKLSLANIDFARAVNEIMMLEKKKGLPSKIEIRKDIASGPDMEMHSDKELVRIILENLIDNAIKFYNESEKVDSFVEVIIAPMDDKHIKVRVIDNGIGISESNPGKLFQMFFRASERSEIGGIGLYIVKTATTKVGGKVGLLTTPEGYTEFYVIFPKNPPTGEEWPAKLTANVFKK